MNDTWPVTRFLKRPMERVSDLRVIVWDPTKRPGLRVCQGPYRIVEEINVQVLNRHPNLPPMFQVPVVENL